MMIENIVIDYLEPELSLPVRAEYEDGLPKEYVLIVKTGSGKTNWIKRATIAIKSHSKTLTGAMQLNEKVKEAMNNIIRLDSISKCELNSDYNYTDQQKKLYRYQAVFDIYYY